MTASKNVSATGTAVATPRNAELASYFSQSIMLEESDPPRLASLLIRATLALFVGFVLWAFFTNVDEAAVVPGEIVPSGSTRTVQHLEGGIVAEILVGNGEVVQAGEEILILDGSAAKAELARHKVRAAALKARAARLRALASGGAADFAEIDPAYSDLVDDERYLLAAQIETHRQQRDTLALQIREQEKSLRTLRAQLRNQSESVILHEQQVITREALLKKGLVSKIVVTENKQAANRARGKLMEIEGQIAKNREFTAETKGRLADLSVSAEKDALDEMNKVLGELAEVEEAMARTQDAVSRLKITSPVYGIVNALQVNSLGDVVAPGAPIAEVVSLNEELVVEARISPRDIGHIRTGQSVKVKVEGYDYSRYGSVNGTLSRLSASSLKDPEGEPYFKGVLELEQEYLGANAEDLPILPGMTVTADIKTGERSILSYLLKPINRSLGSAFSER